MEDNEALHFPLAGLSNQLTRLPVFTVNYVMQVKSRLWPACKMGWK